MSNQLREPGAAHENLPSFYDLLVIAEANTDNTAWFSNDAQTVWHLSDVVENEADRLRPYTHRYYQWELADPTNPTIVANDKGNLTSRDPFISGQNIRQLVVPTLCSAFMRQATTANTIGIYTESFAKWSQVNYGPHTSETFSFITNLIGRSLLAADQNPLIHPQSRAVQALGTITPSSPNYRPTVQAMESVITMCLSERGGVGARSIFATEVAQAARERRSEVLEVATTMDDVGILNERFWYAVGAVGGGVLRIPGMLELTHERLQAPKAMDYLRLQEVSSVESVVRLYVQRLVDHYLKDETRDQESLTKIRAAASNDRGGLGLVKLVAIGEVYTHLINEQRKGTGQESLSPLTRTDPRDLGAAFIRIMRAIEPATNAAEVKKQHAAEDAMHADIIQLLRSFLRDKASKLTTEDLQLRYPDATREDLDKMMQLQQTGTPAKAGLYWRRKQRSQQNIASGGNLKRPGYGLLS